MLSSFLLSHCLTDAASSIWLHLHALPQMATFSGRALQELALMVARSRAGDTQSFPVAETKHKDSVLRTTLS